MKQKLYRSIAVAIQARDNCIEHNRAYVDHWNDRLEWIQSNLLPHGSGFDNGTTINNDSTPDRLIFNTAFHHMDDNGMYGHWTDHQVIIRASLTSGFDIRITGRNYRDIKDYIGDTFGYLLYQVGDWNESDQWISNE